MRWLIFAVCIAVGAGSSAEEKKSTAPVAQAAKPPAKVSEEDRLRVMYFQLDAENARLTAELGQCRQRETARAFLDGRRMLRDKYGVDLDRGDAIEADGTVVHPTRK
jgi:hypothetical protein